MTKARDPVCGMDVDTETALSAKIGDRTYYFCSQSCLDIYTQPQRELKAMKRRVTLTLLGVVAAGILKIVGLFGVVAALMSIEIVGGGPSVIGVVVLIICTPIVWIAGFGTFKGAILSLKNKNANMDVLVGAGVLAGWIYGVAATLLP